MSTAQDTDNRISEILQLASEEGLPLALSPQAIVALEDCGWIVDPFTGQTWRDPDWACCRELAITAIEGKGICMLITDATAMPSGTISDNDVTNVLNTLHTRLNETSADYLLTRPLHRRQVMMLYRIVLAYQELRQSRKED
jgi:hypothetical protein